MILSLFKHNNAQNLNIYSHIAAIIYYIHLFVFQKLSLLIYYIAVLCSELFLHFAHWLVFCAVVKLKLTSGLVLLKTGRLVDQWTSTAEDW